MITKEETKHVAGLARIGASEDEIDKFSKDLSVVLDWIDELKEVNIEGVEPTAHISGVDNVARIDGEKSFSNSKDIIGLFPEIRDNYDKVRSVL